MILFSHIFIFMFLIITNVAARTSSAKIMVAGRTKSADGNFDANENKTLTITGDEYPAELFTVSFKAESVSAGSKLDIALSGMSLKLTSDSENEASMQIVNTDKAKDTVNVVAGISALQPHYTLF